MVARPPLKLLIEPMRVADLDAVHQIELASFNAPWPANAYRSELETNRLASYLVARIDDRIVAYGGMWLMVDEAHITTFAVHPAWRRQRIGERLLVAFLDLAADRSAREATLEVRLSNGKAYPAEIKFYSPPAYVVVGTRTDASGNARKEHGRDVAILKVEDKELPVVRLARHSTDLHLGQALCRRAQGLRLARRRERRPRQQESDRGRGEGAPHRRQPSARP